jgi:hypothetical protein
MANDILIGVIHEHSIIDMAPISHISGVFYTLIVKDKFLETSG